MFSDAFRREISQFLFVVDTLNETKQNCLAAHGVKLLDLKKTLGF